MAHDRDDELDEIVKEVKGYAEEEAVQEITENVEKEIRDEQPAVVPQQEPVSEEEPEEEIEVLAKKKKSGKGKKVLIGVCAVVIAAFAVVSAYAMSYPNIHMGIRCEGISLSEMTVKQAKEALNGQSDSILKGKNVQIEINGKTYDIDVPSVAKGINSDKSAQNAYDYTHTGSFFTRVWHTMEALAGGADVPMEVSVDADKIQQRFDEISEEALVAATAPTYEVKGDQLVVTMGVDGVSFDQKKALKQVKQKIAVLDFTPLKVDMITEKAPELDFEQMKKDMDCEPENAKVDTKDGTTIIAEKPGVQVDLEKAKEIVGDGTEKTYSIPVTLTPANITAEKLKEVLFRDTLGTATTNLNAGLRSRTSNVRLAAQFINGKVLNPGDEFSYNDTVGPRTEERGFQNAMVFQDGGVVEGLGGGICQTSSTLYMSVLRADLKVTERRNHTFVVSYTPMGQDATVAYGSQDFKFVNDTDYPIKIVASQSGSSVTVTLKGTKVTDKTVELSHVVNSTTKMKTVEKVDKNLKPGQTRTEGGYTGYNVTLYKTVTENGKSEKSVANHSRYASKDRIVYKGPEAPKTTIPAKTETNTNTNTTTQTGNQNSGSTTETPTNPGT